MRSRLARIISAVILLVCSVLVGTWYWMATGTDERRAGLALDAAPSTLFLEVIVRRGRVEEVRGKALWRIHDSSSFDQDVAIEVASRPDTPDELRRLALTLIADGEALVRMVAESSDAGVCLATLEFAAQPDRGADYWVPRLVGAIHDQRILAALVRRGSSTVRNAAACELQDQDVLLELALHDADVGVRQCAAENLTRQDSLLAVIRAGTDLGQRLCFATNHVIDRSSLVQLATRHTEPRMRAAVTSCLRDEQVLGGIALNDPSPEVRVAAVENLSQAPLLLQLANADPDVSVRGSARNRLSDGLGFSRPQTEYELLATRHRDPFIRELAMERLAGIGKGAGSSFIARDRIDGIVYQICRCDASLRVRKEASELTDWKCDATHPLDASDSLCHDRPDGSLEELRLDFPTRIELPPRLR